MNGTNDRPADAAVSVWASLLAALVAALGSLWLTMGMELEACPLCFYQRACVLGVVGVLAVGLLLRDQSATGLGLIALPIALGGLGVSLVHNYLEYSGKLECPQGIAGYGTAPQQALVAQTILVFFLLIAGRGRVGALLAALLLGAGVAWLLFATAPKPVAPTKPYPENGRLLKCRVPFKAPEGN